MLGLSDCCRNSLEADYCANPCWIVSDIVVKEYTVGDGVLV